MTTTADDQGPAAGQPIQRAGPMAHLTVRELVIELTEVEDALRTHPGRPDLVVDLRLVVRELRRRRAGMRGQAGPPQDAGPPPP